MRRRLVALRQALDALPEDRERRVSAALDLIWADFSGATVHGDGEALDRRRRRGGALRPDGAAGAALARAVVNLQPEFGIGADDAPTGKIAVNPRYAVVLSAIRGLALSRAFEPRAGHVRDPWPAHRAELERYLLS